MGDLSAYSGWIIRSGTRITKEMLAQATSLRVVGRAGVGVDNVDLSEATRRGILVLNAPDGNTISTAEHTCAMLLAMARRIPSAHASLQSGAWERKRFKGAELYEKTLGIVGLGKIGREVGARMRAFGMRIMACDPVIAPAAAERLGVTLVSYPELLAGSDLITFHVPLIDETRDMLNAEALAMCRDGVCIVNCARGGLLDERAVLAGLESGKVGGVALDVYRQEPPIGDDRALLEHPAVVSTPHIAASTGEAQERVARQVTEQLIGALRDEPVTTAVNSMAIRLAAQPELKPYLELAEKLGSLVGQLLGGQPSKLKIRCYGDWLRQYEEILSVAAVKGLVARWSDEPVNLINARIIAELAGLSIEEQLRPADQNFKNLVEVMVVGEENKMSAAGVVFGNRQPRIIRVDEYDFEIQPSGHILFYYNDDKPGMLASVGAILATAGINIGALALGRQERGSTAMTAISTDESISTEVLNDLRGIDGVSGLQRVNFGEPL